MKKKILAVVGRGAYVFPMFALLEDKFEIIYLTREDFELMYSRRIDDFISALLEYDVDYLFVDTCFEVWEDERPYCGQGCKLSKLILEKSSSKRIIGVTSHPESQCNQLFGDSGMEDIVSYVHYHDEGGQKMIKEMILNQLEKLY